MTNNNEVTVTCTTTIIPDTYMLELWKQRKAKERRNRIITIVGFSILGIAFGALILCAIIYKHNSI